MDAVTRCKFKIDSIEKSLGNREKKDPSGNVMKYLDGHQHAGRTIYEPCEMWTLKASPVYHNGDPNHENSKFWHYTPSGQLTMSTINRAAVEHFALGMEFYMDLTPAGPAPVIAG